MKCKHEKASINNLHRRYNRNDPRSQDEGIDPIQLSHDHRSDSRIEAFELSYCISCLAKSNCFIGCTARILGRAGVDHRKEVYQYDGFVILHGTDTMAYTASALSYMLENLGKPVILTGSQLPLGVIRTDAKRNLITAIEIAASKKLVPEVCIYFNSQLFRGNRAEKFTSSKFDAFQSLNFPVLAEAGVEMVFDERMILPKPKKKLKVNYGFNEHVLVLKLFPGLSPAVIDALSEIKSLRGIVLETFGSGNAPSTKKFLDSIERLIKNGIVVLNISQCSGGMVNQNKYETGIGLRDIGVISGGDMTTEAAITKMMFLLNRYSSRSDVKRELKKDHAGELSL